MTQFPGRRAFLGGVAATMMSCRLSRAHASLIEPIPRTGVSRLRLSIAAYSYRDLLDFKKKSMDMFGFATLAAELGCDAIEPTTYWFPPEVDAAWLASYKLHAFRLGLDISGTAIGNDFCLPPGPKRDEEIAKTKDWIDRAAILGAPVIRIFGGTVPEGEDEESAAARVIQTIDEVLPYAAEKGISLAIENHGGITATPEKLLRLVTGVKAPQGNFGVNLDTHNFHGEDPYADVARLAPYAINVQVKTEMTPAAKPKQPVDFGRLIEILRQARYSGYVVLEYEAEEDPLTAIPRHLKELRSLIGPRG
jgi:sugar phosphate isomerase/epimerase